MRTTPHVSQSLSTNLDKLDFGEPTASGNLSPEGDRIIAQRGAATRQNAGFGIKNNRNPDQRGGVAGKRS